MENSPLLAFEKVIVFHSMHHYYYSDVKNMMQRSGCGIRKGTCSQRTVDPLLVLE